MRGDTAGLQLRVSMHSAWCDMFLAGEAFREKYREEQFGPSGGRAYVATKRRGSCEGVRENRGRFRKTMTPIEQFFDALEHTELSLWVRGPSMLAFLLILTVHTIGMGFLAGTSSAIDLRILGLARRVPLPALEKFYPIIWTALAANFVS